MYHTATQHCSSPAGPVFLQVFSRRPLLGWTYTYCLYAEVAYRNLYTIIFVEEFQLSLNWELNPCLQCWVPLLIVPEDHYVIIAIIA